MLPEDHGRKIGFLVKQAGEAHLRFMEAQLELERYMESIGPQSLADLAAMMGSAQEYLNDAMRREAEKN